MQAWLSDHKLVSYLIILGFTIYIFNQVFRAQQKLPILKEVLVYLLMAFGSFILMILQVDKLPIIQCMAVAVAMMLMLRGRQFYDKWKGNKAAKIESQNAESSK
ncbi:YlaH-like family protein [Paenibacillus sp. L3-i20]|uniref:YlaH-like family protein n=1 Tax=Paenibacillus sp. L3-i20 TaxID=2905833 RepID=UPI001EDF7EF0|nr:YlaH-like family protein [Paenibacillus sp. L3-i20]GKU78339.1 hypothetical protein L3i20_v227360 [Paenibacillus sp. L3-i20]